MRELKSNQKKRNDSDKQNRNSGKTSWHKESLKEIEKKNEIIKTQMNEWLIKRLNTCIKILWKLDKL